jgi:hypothetical protein
MTNKIVVRVRVREEGRALATTHLFMAPKIAFCEANAIDPVKVHTAENVPYLCCSLKAITYEYRGMTESIVCIHEVKDVFEGGTVLNGRLSNALV